MAKGVTIDFNANVVRFQSSVDRMTNDLAKFQTNADRISKNVNKSFERLGSGLQGVLGGITAAVGVRELAQMADSYSNMQARLKLATRSAEEFALANESIKRIAAASASPLEETATLYTRIAQSLLDVGGTQKQIADTTEALALSLKISGATAAESASAMTQFSQAIASGVLRGEEFNSVNEAAPRVMKALADAIGVPVGKLREMAEQGKLTRDILVEGLGSQLPKLVKEAAALPNTIESAFQNAKNELLLTVGAIDKLTGASAKAAESIGLIGKAFKGWSAALGGSDADSAISDQLRKTQQLMDSALKMRKLFDALGMDPPKGASDSYINKLNQQALELKRSLESVREESAKAAAGPSDSDAGIKALLAKAEAGKKAAEAEKRAAEVAKKAALEREKIFQHEIDTELEAFNKFHKERERLAKESQQALDSMMQEGRSLQLSVDPMARMNAEMERYSELLKAGAINQKTFDLAVAKSAAELERATSGNAERLKASVAGTSEHMNAVLIGFQTNVQRNLGDTLFRSLSGDFDNIGNAWKTMLLRMASDAAAANLSRVIFGEDGTGGSGLLGKGLSLLGSVLGLIGGGGAGGGTASYTGYGGLGAPRMFAKGGIVDSPTPFRFAEGGAINNGLMGEAGPEAIMPLKRDSQGRLGVSVQGRSGGGIVLNQTINIDSRTDRAEVHALVSRAVRQGNAELVDRLGRQGVI